MFLCCHVLKLFGISFSSILVLRDLSLEEHLGLLGLLSVLLQVLSCTRTEYELRLILKVLVDAFPDLGVLIVHLFGLSIAL